MTSLLPTPEQVFLSNDGAPLVGGKIFTYIPSTLTPKTTWQDAGQVVMNTNPIILDSAGRALIYGSGAYRFRVTDALDNLIYDENTASTLDESAISAVMLPVAGAATLATARRLLGVDAAIASALAGATTLVGPTGPTGPQGPTGTSGGTGPSGAGYQPLLTSANPGSMKFPNANGTATNITIQFGTATTDATGNANVTFLAPFPGGCFMVLATAQATSWWANVTSFNSSGFVCTTSSPLHGGGWPGAIGFTWAAFGN